MPIMYLISDHLYEELKITKTMLLASNGLYTCEIEA